MVQFYVGQGGIVTTKPGKQHDIIHMALVGSLQQETGGFLYRTRVEPGKIILYTGLEPGTWREVSPGVVSKVPEPEPEPTEVMTPEGGVSTAFPERYEPAAPQFTGTQVITGSQLTEMLEAKAAGQSVASYYPEFWQPLIARQEQPQQPLAGFFSQQAQSEMPISITAKSPEAAQVLSSLLLKPGQTAEVTIPTKRFEEVSDAKTISYDVPSTFMMTKSTDFFPKYEISPTSGKEQDVEQFHYVADEFRRIDAQIQQEFRKSEAETKKLTEIYESAPPLLKIGFRAQAFVEDPYKLLFAELIPGGKKAEDLTIAAMKKSYRMTSQEYQEYVLGKTAVNIGTEALMWGLPIGLGGRVLTKFGGWALKGGQVATAGSKAAKVSTTAAKVSSIAARYSKDISKTTWGLYGGVVAGEATGKAAYLSTLKYTPAEIAEIVGADVAREFYQFGVFTKGFELGYKLPDISPVKYGKIEVPQAPSSEFVQTPSETLPKYLLTYPEQGATAKVWKGIYVDYGGKEVRALLGKTGDKWLKGRFPTGAEILKQRPIFGGAFQPSGSKLDYTVFNRKAWEGMIGKTYTTETGKRIVLSSQWQGGIGQEYFEKITRGIREPSLMRVSGAKPKIRGYLPQDIKALEGKWPESVLESYRVGYERGKDVFEFYGSNIMRPQLTAKYTREFNRLFGMGSDIDLSLYLPSVGKQFSQKFKSIWGVPIETWGAKEIKYFYQLPSETMPRLGKKVMYPKGTAEEYVEYLFGRQKAVSPSVPIRISKESKLLIEPTFKKGHAWDVHAWGELGAPEGAWGVKYFQPPRQMPFEKVKSYLGFPTERKVAGMVGGEAQLRKLGASTIPIVITPEIKKQYEMFGVRGLNVGELRFLPAAHRIKDPYHGWIFSGSQAEEFARQTGRKITGLKAEKAAEDWLKSFQKDIPENLITGEISKKASESFLPYSLRAPSRAIQVSKGISKAIFAVGVPSVSTTRLMEPSKGSVSKFLSTKLSTSLKISPSISPSVSPSISPSISPKVSPSISPSMSPSISPSVSPSESPSPSPSISPSISPSTDPGSPPPYLYPSYGKTPLKKIPRQPLYKIEVKRRGKWEKEAGLLPYTAALNRGSNIVDTTPSARFRVRKDIKAKSRAPTMLEAEAWKSIQKKFRPYRVKKKKKYPLKQEWIEREKYRIDSPGELMGITEKGIRAPRKPKARKAKRKRFTPEEEALRIFGM